MNIVLDLPKGAEQDANFAGAEFNFWNCGHFIMRQKDDILIENTLLFTENKPYLKKLKQQINLNITTYEYSAIIRSESPGRS